MSRPAATYELTDAGKIALYQAEWDSLQQQREGIRDGIEDMEHETIKPAEFGEIMLTMWEEYHRIEDRQRELENHLTALGAKGWVST